MASQPEHEAIAGAVQRINDSWREGRYDGIGAEVAEEAVIASPGFEHRIRGRSAYVQSYRDYDQAAKTVEFTPGDPRIDVVGEVAVAVCPFHIAYEIQGTTHRESGYDVLVFSRSDGKWKVAWRTMQATPVAGTTG